MSPLFWQSRLFNFIFFTFFVFSPMVKGQTSLFEELKSNIKEHKTRLTNSLKNFPLDTELEKKIKSSSIIKFNSEFIYSIGLYSPPQFLELIGPNNSCLFYSMLENKLLKTALGEIDELPVIIQNKDEEVRVRMNLTSFLTSIYNNKCINQKAILSLFNNANIKKTIESLKISRPQTTKECESRIKSWKKNPYLSYVCKIPFSISKNLESKSFYQKNISFADRDYLKNLCSNLNDTKKFCVPYLKKDLWNKVLVGESPDYLLKYKCLGFLNLKNKNINKDKISACAAKFNQAPKNCSSIIFKNHPTNFPFLSCDELSTIQTNQNLRYNYLDCPAQIDSLFVTNIYRIKSHFSPDKQEMDAKNCSYLANKNFFNLLNDSFKNSATGKDFWPLKVCYKNPATKKQTCLSYVPGENKNDENAENKIVSTILQKTQGARKDLVCKFETKSSYNPSRLKYKNGCYIVFDPKACTPLFCPKKIYLEQKDVTSLVNYKGKAIFDYFFNSFQNERNALHNLMLEQYGLTARKIRNLTELKVFLKQSSENIIHGLGCAHHLFPGLYNQISFNSCDPIPFIVDNHIEQNTNNFINLTSSIDNITFSRKVNWSSLFSSISSYQALHPLKLWTLYGLKKNSL